eukprot:474617-Hanusia_phi.AAC.1
MTAGPAYCSGPTLHARTQVQDYKSHDWGRLRQGDSMMSRAAIDPAATVRRLRWAGRQEKEGPLAGEDVERRGSQLQCAHAVDPTRTSRHEENHDDMPRGEAADRAGAMAGIARPMSKNILASGGPGE